jgi:hypothetical protein
MIQKSKIWKVFECPTSDFETGQPLERNLHG